MWNWPSFSRAAESGSFAPMPAPRSDFAIRWRNRPTGGNTSEAPGTEVNRQRWLGFEELQTEVVFPHAPGRTIGEGDNTLFTALTMNPQPLHLDAAFSGPPSSASGWWTAC